MRLNLALHSWGPALSRRFLVLVSNAAETCGVEAFARLLARAFGGRGQTHVLGSGIGALIRDLRQSDALVFNFPVVAWKKKLLWPSLAALTARMMRRDVVSVLHEWLALDPKRRWVLSPVVLLSTRIVFSAPEIAAEFSQTRLSRFSSKRRVVVPIPPNISTQSGRRQSEHSAALKAMRTRGQLVLGQFGSIYPKKQSGAVLDVAARLIETGHEVGVVFAGSFIKALDNVEAEFFRKRDALGLGERVIVTGYVGGEDELAAIFDEVDVFCYVFAEGLTARRGSVLAAALSGKPVVVNAPEAPGALAHHPLFERLIAQGRIRLVPQGADAATVAEAVLAAAATPLPPLAAGAEIEALWHDVASAVER